ncbi:MAG TPA: Rpn family recombination-promoting nuclease/putative transposase [Eoetvoesiella sp.]
MGRHDASYRRLLHNPQLVRSLFEGILDLRMPGVLDWSRLEPLPVQYISRDLRERSGDLVWRIPLLNSPNSVFVVLLLEHQARGDKYMALRMPTYCCLQYESMLQHGLIARGSRLPVILPVVLYSGERPWVAKDSLSELIDPLPPGLEPYRLQGRYLLVDEGALVRAGGLPDNNLAALLFRLEHNRGIEETQQLVQTIIALTRDDVYTELRLALGEWLRHVLLPRALPEVDLIHAPVTLTEITEMMTEHSRSWTHQWRQEGRLEGKVEGRLEGKMEGKMEGYAGLLATQITRKFGGLPGWAQTRLEHADEATLNRWALQILDAQRIEDVFG